MAIFNVFHRLFCNGGSLLSQMLKLLPYLGINFQQSLTIYNVYVDSDIND